MPRTYYGCNQDNADGQAFCGACGAPLTLNDFISRRVTEQLAVSVRDRDVLETESSIRVFERALGWTKTVGFVFGSLIALLGAGAIYKFADWRSAIEFAKQSVIQTATTAQSEIKQNSDRSVTEMRKAADSATQASKVASSNASRQTAEMQKASKQAKSQFSKEASSIQSDVEAAHSQIQAAGRLQPEMADLQKRLGQATAQLQEQQKVLSSSEDFVKHVFSSHAIEVFDLKTLPLTTYAILPPAQGGGSNTVLYLLLRSTPIPGTLQLQYYIYAQPPNSYFAIVHNLMVFFWGQPPGSLKEQQLSASYFPDNSDKDVIHQLSVRDGRVYADGEPLPKLGQADPDFKGDKWFPMNHGP